MEVIKHLHARSADREGRVMRIALRILGFGGRVLFGLGCINDKLDDAVLSFAQSSEV